MQNALHRLYTAKLTLLATVLLAAGLGLLILGHWLPHAARWHWLTYWPITDIGSGLFTTGMLGVAWQYVDGEDSELRDTERLQRVLADSAPAIRDAVIQGFAFEPADLARVSTPETLDQIITNGLAIRLGDAEFAQEIYDDLRVQAIGSPERLYDARVSIHLAPLPAGRGTARGRAPLYSVTMQWEYRLRPVYATRRFICTSNSAEFRALEQDTAGTSVWYLKAKHGIRAEEKSAFELLAFAVNGEQRTIRRSARADSQVYSVNLGRDAMASAEPVTLSYTYRTVTSVDGHRFRFRVDQPTKGLSVTMDYGDTGIAEMAVLDYIASGRRARITRSPAEVRDRTVSIDFNGWAFPRSGVAFVWTNPPASV